MATRTNRAGASQASTRKPSAAIWARAAKPASLPEWNLADLYAGLDAPEIKRDLDRVDADSLAFEEDYKGRLAELARSAGAGAGLARAVGRYEVLDDLIGRLTSYASLVRAADLTDPARAKFSGDVRER